MSSRKMISQFHQTTNSSTDQETASAIGVKIIGMQEADLAKMRRILQLSVNRKHSYFLCEDLLSDQVQIVVTTGKEPVPQEGIVIVSFGDQVLPECKYHMQSPLLSIRVLRVLDSIELQGKPTETQVQEKEIFHKPEVIPVQTSVVDRLETKRLEYKPVADDFSLAYRVLIIDDSVLIHKALDIQLDKAPFGVNTDYAESGEDGLKLVDENRYDLIFLDVMMPGIDGYETCTQIRKNPSFKKTPVIMLSAKTSPLDEVKGVMAGCTTYLTKPIKHEDFQKLLVRIGNWLENFKTS